MKDPPPPKESVERGARGHEPLAGRELPRRGREEPRDGERHLLPHVRGAPRRPQLAIRSAAVCIVCKDTIEYSNIEYFSPNFEGLVLGCIDADFCK